MITLYGIKNCDSVKKARRWLEAQDLAYRFHDLRLDGLEPALLERWVEALGWERLLNRRGTTWRRLAEHERQGLDAARAAALMLREPTLIKRPVIDTGAELLVGFDADVYRERLGR